MLWNILKRYCTLETPERLTNGLLSPTSRVPDPIGFQVTKTKQQKTKTLLVWVHFEKD